MRALLLLSFLPLLMLAGCGGNPEGGDSGFKQPPDPLAINFWTVNLPNGRVGQWYETYFSITGGVGPFAWSRSEGYFPPGLYLASTNTSTVELSGTPTMAGTWIFTVQVIDSHGRKRSGDFVITIDAFADYDMPASGDVVFIIDASLESSYAGGGYTSQLDAERAKWDELKLLLTTAHNFDVIRIGGVNEYDALFGSLQVASSTNLSTADSNMLALTSSGDAAFYSALQAAVTQYGTGTRVIILGGARPGADSGAPGGFIEIPEIHAGLEQWLQSAPNVRIDAHLFGVNSEVELLFQNLTHRTNGAWYWHQ